MAFRRRFCRCNPCGQLSSVVEQRFCKPSVVGSNPTAGSSLKRFCAKGQGATWGLSVSKNVSEIGALAVLFHYTDELSHNSLTEVGLVSLRLTKAYETKIPTLPPR
jgi:hypothetical protein